MLAEVWKVLLACCSGSSASVLSCRSFHDQQPCCRHTDRLRCSSTRTHLYLNTVVPPKNNHVCPRGTLHYTLLVTSWPTTSAFSWDCLLSSPWQPRTKSPWQQIPPGPGALTASFKLNMQSHRPVLLSGLHRPLELCFTCFLKGSCFCPSLTLSPWTLFFTGYIVRPAVPNLFCATDQFNSRQ